MRDEHQCQRRHWKARRDAPPRRVYATVNSDVAVAVRVDKSGEWKPVSDRGELCGKIVDGDPTPCPEVDKSRALKVNIDLAKKGITQVGEEIFVKFVQNLGLNEFGNPRVRDGQVWERSNCFCGSLSG